MSELKRVKRWARRALASILLGAVACSGGGGGGDDATPLECSNECPEGSRRTSYDKVVAGDAAVVVSSECETACEPILPCTYPNLPLIKDDGSGKVEYSCEPLEGYTNIPKDNEVDFSWAAAAHCTDGAMNDDETGIDCGGALCAPC